MVNIKLHLYFSGWGWGWVVIIKLKANLSSTSHLTKATGTELGNKAWQMNHTHYPELTLTMMDTDSLPVGRHTWKIENNACNQGETSSQVLLMSACQESEFTCDDGKCVNITQRCNNIEVNNLIPISK